MCRVLRLFSELFPQILLTGMLAVCSLGAQDLDDVYSADALEEIRLSQVRSQPQFLYRVQTDSIMRFYKIRMTSSLISSKRTFLWPQDLSPEARPSAPLFGSNEIVFNDSIVQADADALFWKSDTGLVALTRVSSPGLRWVRFDSAAQFQRINRDGLAPSEELPALFYSWGDTATPCWIRSPGFIPREFHPLAKPGTYNNEQLHLIPLPKLSLLPHYLFPELENALPDSATLVQVANAIATLEQGLEADSVLIAEYLTQVRAQVPPPLDMLPGEDSTDYRARVHAREIELIELAKQAYRTCQFSDRMLPVRARIIALQKQLAEGRAELKRNGSPDAIWYSHVVYSRGFLLLGPTLGRNLPDWASAPGPSGLWGLDATVMLPFRIHGQFGWQLSTAFHTSRWQYHAEEHATSNELRASLGAAAFVPILSFPQHNISLALTLGGACDWKSVHARVTGVDDHRFGFAGAVEASFQVLATRLPLLLSGQYRYGTDGFGSLGAQVGIPLLGWRRLP